LEKKKLKQILKYALKVALSGVALYFVFKKVDFQDVKEEVLKANYLYIFLALILFNFSKILSAFRLNHFFKSVGCHISEKYNLRLYYIGMFYNLFLPGGIGGDGYKVYLLNKHKKTKVKDLISATIIDRFSGLAALVFLTIILIFFSTVYQEFGGLKWMFVAGLILIFPAFYFLIRWFFKRFLSIFLITNLQGFGVQLLQLGSAWMIMLALGISIHQFDYLALFLVSSVVAVIPFTLGGLGARELVFSYGDQLMPIDPHTSVAIGTFFFLITAVSSFVGVFLRER
jgi:uncharacterized membrane protein YbhN (UPF0104 family)